jgi:hypothetical protein
VLAAAVTENVPSDVLDGVPSVNHVAVVGSLLTDHTTFDVTATDCTEPDTGKLNGDVETDKAAGGVGAVVPACVTIISLFDTLLPPLTMIVAEREAVVVLAWTVRLIVPVPELDAGLNESHVAVDGVLLTDHVTLDSTEI